MNKTKQQLTDAQLLASRLLECAILAECDEDTHPRITKAAQRKATRIAWQFLEIIRPAALELCKRAYLKRGYGAHPDCGTDRPWLAAMGHDLWLTSQRHGVGFCDRTELCTRLRQHLTACAEKFSHLRLEQYKGWIHLYGNDLITLK